MEMPLPCLSIPAVVDPSLSLVPAANVVQIQATLAPSRISCAVLGCKSTRIRRDCSRRSCKAHCLEAGRQEASSSCQSPAHRVSTTETAHHWHNLPLLPLAPLHTALPSMPALGPPNMFVTPPPSIPLQIDPTLQVSSALPSSSAPTLSSLRTCPRFSQNNGKLSSGSGRNNVNEILLVCENIQKTKHTILVYAWVQVMLLALLSFCH